jgi:hypothetical protein
MKTPTASELLVMVAREAEQRKILAIAKECETLDELVKRLEAIMSK